MAKYRLVIEMDTESEPVATYILEPAYQQVTERATIDSLARDFGETVSFEQFSPPFSGDAA